VASLVGIAGVILPFVLGVLWAKLYGFSTPKAMFVAAAFVATSAGITARVLHDLGALDRIESRVILGAAVIDDILGLLVLALVVGATGASLLATAALSLVAFVPFVGLAALPMQLAAWLLRGLVFQYLGLTAVGAYLKLYRTFARDFQAHYHDDRLQHVSFADGTPAP
jgi:Kef-type K+ transport system membrane component KefB